MFLDLPVFELSCKWYHPSVTFFLTVVFEIPIPVHACNCIPFVFTAVQYSIVCETPVCSSVLRSWRFGSFSIWGCQTMLLWTFCQLQCKLHAGRDFACFVWRLFRHSQCLEQCRAHGRCSVNIWGMNEFLYVSHSAHVQDLLQRSMFSKYGPGTLRVPETFPGDLWGQNYFHKTTKTLFVLFTLIFHEFKYFPGMMTSSLW